MRTFAPAYGQGVTASVTSSNISGEIDRNKNRSAIVVTNLGATTIYVRTGDSSVAASASTSSSDYPVLAGAQVSLTKDIQHTHVAVITASGTSTVNVIAGTGI